MTTYILTPPTEEYGPAGGGRLFIRYRLTRGKSLQRNNGISGLKQLSPQKM
jgi:hypothetical protein